MNRPRYLDILILLGFLLLFSAGVSLLAKAEKTSIASDETLSDKTVMNQLAPLFMARNSKKISEFLAQRPHVQQLRVITLVLNDQKNPFTITDKIKLLLDIARKTQNNDHRKKLYNVLVENENVAIYKPLLFVAAENNYDDLIGSIAEWLSEHPDIFSDWFYKGMSQAIKENKPAVANKMLARFLTISPEVSTKLLWEVIKGKKSAEFIAPLIKKSALVNSPFQGKTPLIGAVENEQREQVIALLENGAKAQINKIVDPAVGSALQMARKKKNVGIEQLLRKYGAKE